MPAVQITPLTTTDAPALSEIALRAYRDHYLDYWYDRGEWYMKRSFDPAVLSAELADPTALFFLVSLDSEPVGFLKINPDHPLPGTTDPRSFELERIYLIGRVTGRGVGRAALTFTENLGRERGKTVLWLKAMDTSDALQFYNRVGFETCGTLQLEFPQMKVERRGMVILKKAI
ncbi:GNAT family N-acetyltransferase [Rudanella lutea]|uniref:GNAT family N-acetyltransferase n=1 Tax=Rudanella lutea TaxID=451374 RepID=UPI00036D812D|nr:GNAT family N-acetyltransferase [Rudanella lutea]